MKALMKALAIASVVVFFACFSASASEPALTLHRGINLSSWFANAPRQPLTAKDFKEIKALGFDFVRLPINPEFIGFNLDTNERKDQNLDLRKVEATVKGLIDAGLVVILDVHPENEFKMLLELGGGAEEQFVGLWQNLSRTFRRYPNSHLAYELLNEPQYYKKTKRYNEFIAKVVAAVRTTEPDRTLVLNTPGVMSLKPVDALKATALIADPNIIYDVHYYQPYIVSHQGMASGFETEQIRFFNHVPYPSGLVDFNAVRSALAPGATERKAMREVETYVNERWNIDRITEDLAPVAQWAKANNVRVTVLEFGVLRDHIDSASRYRWIEDVRKAMENLGIPWALWDYTDGFGIMKLAGKTLKDADGTIRFENPYAPENRRIVEPEAIKAMGLPSLKPVLQKK
jgi:hypothetical protein